MFLKFYNKVEGGLPDTCVIECDAYNRSVYRDQERWDEVDSFYAPFGIDDWSNNDPFPENGIAVFEIFREQDDPIDRMILSETIAIVDFDLYVENVNGKTVDRYTG